MWQNSNAEYIAGICYHCAFLDAVEVLRLMVVCECLHFLIFIKYRRDTIRSKPWLLRDFITDPK